MKTIAIANFKGGVGKTATAVNLAALLAREGRPTLLIDADPQHNATDFYLPEFEGITLTDVLTGDCEPVWEDNVSPTNYSFLAMLPADMRLLMLDLRAFLGGGTDGMDKRLFDFLECAKGDEAYDFCLIDCPPSFTASSVAAIYAADDIIIPTEADLFSITGLTTLVKQVESVRRFKPNIRVAGALITKWHNTAACIQGECALRGSAVPVFRQTIRRSDKVTESIFAGQALQAYSPQSAAGRDYRAFVAEYLEEVS